jgi:hypothetical protein
MRNPLLASFFITLWASMYLPFTKSFSGFDGFCDENGKTITEMPGMDWKCVFKGEGDTTKVAIEVTFASEADMEKIVEMGFKEGFAAAHANLDELLAKQ